MALRTRLLLATGAVALVALVVAGVVTYSALRSFLYSRVDQSLLQAAPPVHTNLDTNPGGGDGGPGPGGGPGEGSGPPGAIAHYAPGDFAESRASDGTVVSGPFPAYIGGRSYLPKIPTTLTGFHRADRPGGGPAPEVAFFTVGSTTAGGPTFRVLAVQEADGSVLLLGTPLTDTLSTLQHLVLVELAVTAAALAAALGVGLWLVRLGLRPLRDVEATAGSIAEGNFDQRVPGANDSTEVGRLARSLNVMLNEIEHAFAERDATEAELRRSEHMLRQFVADASHELRTPLAAVSAYAELFERGARERPEDLERVMTGIRQETGRMRRLVEDLLLLARLDEGQAVEHRPVELVRLVDEAARTAAAVGPAWPVVVRAARPVEVTGDDLRLRQVVDNLLGNVRAHTPAGTTTTVSVEVDGDQAVLVVADDGPGFGPDHGAHVFERFYRAESSRSRAHGGAGLGLAIVAALVAAHGGQVAAGDAPGGGAQVVVRLPLTAPEPVSAPPAAITG